MTVAQLENTMSNVEYIRWTVYFGRKAQRQELAMKRRR